MTHSDQKREGVEKKLSERGWGGESSSLLMFSMESFCSSKGKRAVVCTLTVSRSATEKERTGKVIQVESVRSRLWVGLHRATQLHEAPSRGPSESTITCRLGKRAGKRHIVCPTEKGHWPEL